MSLVSAPPCRIPARDRYKEDRFCMRFAAFSARFTYPLFQTNTMTSLGAASLPSLSSCMRLFGWRTRSMFDRYNIIDEVDLAAAVAMRFEKANATPQLQGSVA